MNDILTDLELGWRWKAKPIAKNYHKRRGKHAENGSAMAILRPLDLRNYRNIRPGEAHTALSERYVETVLPEDPSQRAISRSSPIHRLTTGPISVKRTIDYFI